MIIIFNSLFKYGSSKLPFFFYLKEISKDYFTVMQESNSFISYIQLADGDCVFAFTIYGVYV